MNDKLRGWYEKFIVTRTDHRDRPGQKHSECDYFVIDLMHDRFAEAALLEYARVCEFEYPLLAADIRKRLKGKPK